MKTISLKSQYAIAAMLSLVLIMLDQCTKYLAVIFLKDSEPFQIIEGVFCLKYLENTGAAFGMMRGKQGFFFVITSIVLILLIYAYSRIPAEKKFIYMRVCAILLFSGAVGNLIDRVSYNYVIDFLYFELINFPIFNVADIYVTVTTAIFILLILFYYKDEDLEEIKIFKKKKTEENNS